MRKAIKVLTELFICALLGATAGVATVLFAELIRSLY